MMERKFTKEGLAMFERKYSTRKIANIVVSGILGGVTIGIFMITLSVLMGLFTK